MATLTLTSKHALTGTYTSSGDLTTPTEPVAISDSQAYTNGTGANQANAFFSDTRSLGVSTPETIDLTADLVDAFGTTQVLTSIREIIIRNNSTTTGQDITISGNVLDGMMGGTTVLATGTLTLTANAANTETVTLDSKTYTFQTALTDVDGNVLIGATASDSLDNLIAAITLGSGAGTTYATSTTLHPTVTAVAGAGDTMDVTAKIGTTAGNAIASTETMGTGSFGGATLSGGTGAEEIVGPSGEWKKSSPRDGYTVTNTTQDQLTVDPGANALTYDLIIIGTV